MIIGCYSNEAKICTKFGFDKNEVCMKFKYITYTINFLSVLHELQSILSTNYKQLIIKKSNISTI